MWKDLKFPHVIYMTLHIIWGKNLFLSAMEFGECDAIKGCVQKAFS